MAVSDLLTQFLSAKDRYAALFADRGRSLPAVRIGSKKPKASRRSINRTATPQEHKAQPLSGANAYFPASYGPCEAATRMLAVGNIGTDFVYAGWFAFGEIEEIVKVRCNGDDVPVAVTITEYTGTTTQTVDSTLQSAISGYNDDQVITVGGTDIGIAYIVARVPAGAVKGYPRFTVQWKGNKNIYDPRDASTAYSDNPALCFRDWLKSSIYGPEFDVDDDTVKTTADACDEAVGTTWTAITAKSLGDFVVPTTGNTLNRSYECTTAGVTKALPEPTWNTTIGATTTDSTVTWTCRDGRRRVCGMLMDKRADVRSWVETWRTAAGCIVNWGENGVEMIPDIARATDHTFKHADADIRENPPLELYKEGLANKPNVVQIIYTNTSGNPWRDGTDARVAAAGVDAGTVPERLSIIRMPWIHRKAQAIREATERYNAATLTDLGFSLAVFDRGLEVKSGDVSEVTHPIGLTDKKVRAMGNAQDALGKWTIDYWEYDPAVYSNHIETEPTYPDFELHTGVEIDFAGQITGSEKPADNATVGATWKSNITDQPDDALLLNELNCVGGYQEVSLPKEDGSPNCIDCYINNSGIAQWFKIAEFDLTGNYNTCTWNGLFSYGGSGGRYTSQMRVRLTACTDGASALIQLGYKYSGDDKTANLKVAYVGVVVTVYAHLGAYSSCLFDGAWSAKVTASNSWIHTEQDQTDNIGTGTPTGTYLTPAKNYTLGADITGDNTANDASSYTGAAISVTYTAADITNDNTADDTDHINGCINETGVVRIDDELRIYGTDLTFYSAAAYRGKIYCNSTYMILDSPSFIGADTLIPNNSTDDLGSALFPWDNLHVDDIYADSITITEAAITLGSVGTPFTLHVYDTGSSSWVTYDSYIT